MRIAILTLPLHTNFGGILQCYALQTVLERMGHEIFVLDNAKWTSCTNLSLWKRSLLFARRLVKFYILHKESKFYGGKSESQIIQHYIQPFINSHIHKLKISSFKTISENQFDAFIVGSDQIWRPVYYTPIEDAFLEFAQSWNHIKRISYAASFGVDEWEYSPEQTQKCIELIKLFDAVSVREYSGIRLCKDYLQTEAIQVLDPTLLLTQNDYLKLIENIEKKNKGIFCYILDKTKEKENIINNIIKEIKLQPFDVEIKLPQRHAPFEERIRLPVEKWICAFRDAQFVITDSFHGCVFSILFQKNFIVYGNEKRGLARFQSLLSLFGLENRLVTNLEQNGEFSLEDIDWEIVTKKLQDFRNRSMLFLIMNINNGK